MSKYKKLNYALAKQKQRFALRKLSVGVASVMLGTVFFIQGGAIDVHAATDNHSVAHDISPQGNNETPAVDAGRSTLSLQSNNTDQENHSSGRTAGPQVFAAPDLSNKLVPEARGASEPHNTELSVRSQDSRNELSMDNDQTGNVEGNKNIRLKLMTAEMGQYEVTIPTSNVYEVKSANLDPAYGTSTQTIVNGRIVYKYDITYDGVINIPISITTNNNYGAKATPMPDIGKSEKMITWSVNGEEQDPLTFYQTITPEWNPKQPVRTNPDPDQVRGVQVGTNVTYTLNLNETPGVMNGLSYSTGRVNSAVNYGTVITIPVPAGFKLDEAATMTANNFRDQTTITQNDGAGGDIIITVPKGSGNQAFQTSAGYQLVGKYDMEQPENDLPVSTPHPIVVVQKIGDGENAPTKEATIPSFTDTIIGKHTDISLGNFYIGAKTAYGNKKIPVTSNDIVVGYFGLQNSTILAYGTNNKLDIKLTFPDGLTVNKVTVPVGAINLPGTTNYTYSMVLKNGETVTGEVAAGQSVSADSSIQSITFNPNVWSIGAKTDSLPDNSISSQNTTVSAFIAYGHVNDTYDNGSAIRTGDQLTSTLAIETGTLSGSTTATQQVVLPEDEVANEAVFNYQFSNVSSTKRAGYLSVYVGTQQESSTTGQIFEPVFYYVLPTSTIPNSPLQIENPNSATIHPTVTEFNADGRTVVKIDYTGTGYHFITTRPANNSLWLDNQSDATNSVLPWDIYVISPQTKMSNSKYSDATKNSFSTSPATNPFNLSWVENNTDNLYHVGGGNWNIQQIAGVTSQVMIKGNENTNFGPTGLSDDKGSPEMQIGVSIINGTDPALNNANAYISVPTTTNGSGFNFQLTGETTSDRLPYSNVADYTITYSTENHDIYNSEPDETFVTADQVTDWSKIKTIKVSIPHIDGRDVLGRLILKGTDPTITTDAGKVGYVKTALYAPGFATYTNKNNPVMISVKGKSTITSRYRYVDADGNVQTINIPDRTYTYQDNTDNMITKTQAINNLTNADKALIPAGYVFDGSVELLAPTSKSWATDAPIGTPEFGSKVQYFYNNAIIEYQLVKNYTTVSQTKEVTRTVHYVDKTTGQPMPSDLAPTVTQTVTLTNYAVRDTSGNIIGYNTTGTWDGNSYTPSVEVNGLIRVDTTNEDESWMNLDGQKWSAVTNPDLKQKGYSGPFEEDGLTTFDDTKVAETTPTGTTGDDTVTVYYTEDVVEVTPGELQEPGTTIPGYIAEFPEGVTERDLNKTITRTIKVFDADGQLVDTKNQDVKYTRTATVNVVTKELTYGDWISENDEWPEYTPTLSDDEIIYQVLDQNGQNYANTTTDNGVLNGIGAQLVTHNDSGETANIYLGKAVNFTGHRTIIYDIYDKHGDRVSSSSDNSQSVSVAGVKYYDPSSETGKYEFTDPSQTYTSINVPIKTGYYSSSKTVPTMVVTIDNDDPKDTDLDATAIVEYHPMGQVIQIDGEGNQIPGTTPVTYPNDPDDPTKAGEVTVPSTPDGWIIVRLSDDESFVPADPGEDTKIVYKRVIPPVDDNPSEPPHNNENNPSTDDQPAGNDQNNPSTDDQPAGNNQNNPSTDVQPMSSNKTGSLVNEWTTGISINRESSFNKTAKNQQVLPQTGNQDGLMIEAFGLSSICIFISVGLWLPKRRNEGR